MAVMREVGLACRRWEEKRKLSQGSMGLFAISVEGTEKAQALAASGFHTPDGGSDGHVHI